MKKGLVLVGVLLLIFSSFGYAKVMVAPGVQPVRVMPQEYRVDNNTVALYHFNEGMGIITRDATSNNNHGTLQNGTSFINQNPPLEGSIYSIRFDGIDDSVKILDSTSLDIVNNITVEAWIYIDGTTNYPARIVSKWQTSNWMTGRSWLLQLVNQNKVGFWIRNAIQPGPNDQDGVVSANSVPTNQWIHVAGVFNGTDIMIYVNGRLEGTKHFQASIYQSVTNVGIGADVDDPNQYNFKGYIDEVMVSDKARKPSEFNA